VKRKFILASIIIFFLLTRIIKIVEIPPSVYWDEASIGYNAYSILKTGKDEWGEFLPLHFRAFGEFKLPAYIYTVVIFGTILGFNELAVRLPAVLYSLLSVVFFYLLIKRLFAREDLSIVSVLVLITSPWFLLFSRVGYEASAGLAFFLASLYFFAKGSSSLIYGLLFLILSFYSYNSFRIISLIMLPIIFVYAFFLVKKENWFKKLRLLLPMLFVVIVSLLPVLKLYYMDSGLVRLSDVGITKDATLLTVLALFLKNFLLHLDPKFLFLNGDSNLRSHIGTGGELLLVSAPFLAVGFFNLFKKFNLNSFIVLSLLVVSLIPASITKESPHALRAIGALPFFSLIIALGILKTIDFFKKKASAYIFLFALFLISFLFNFYFFINTYPKNSSLQWQYPYKILFTKYQPLFDLYDKVIITDKYAQPYIFALFYLRFDPESFRQNVEYNSYDKWGFSTVGRFNKYIFTSDISGKVNEVGDEKVLIISDREINTKKLPNTVNLLNNKPSLFIYE